MHVNLNNQIVQGTKEELLGKIFFYAADAQDNLRFCAGLVTEEFPDRIIVSFDPNEMDGTQTYLIMKP